MSAICTARASGAAATTPPPRLVVDARARARGLPVVSSSSPRRALSPRKAATPATFGGAALAFPDDGLEAGESFCGAEGGDLASGILIFASPSGSTASSGTPAAATCHTSRAAGGTAVAQASGGAGVARLLLLAIERHRRWPQSLRAAGDAKSLIERSRRRRKVIKRVYR